MTLWSGYHAHSHSVIYYTNSVMHSYVKHSVGCDDACDKYEM